MGGQTGRSNSQPRRSHMAKEQPDQQQNRVSSDNTDLYYQILSKKADQQSTSARQSLTDASRTKKGSVGRSRAATQLPKHSRRRESGFKYVFDLQKERWVTFEVKLEIDERPFQQGTMRLCFKAYEYDQQGERFPSVVKVYKDPRDGPRAYFREAITQMIAESYAQKFNATSPVEKVAILPIAVCRLQHPLHGSFFCTVEPFLPGEYIKHSDNVGTVATSDPVPQAFSHFTYEVSQHLLVVCDIQGVSNFYTDPQIHSVDGKGFGLGNLGQQGISGFLATHVCNHVCRALRLPGVVHRSSSSSKLSSSTGYNPTAPHAAYHRGVSFPAPPRHRRFVSPQGVSQAPSSGSMQAQLQHSRSLPVRPAQPGHASHNGEGRSPAEGHPPAWVYQTQPAMPHAQHSFGGAQGPVLATVPHDSAYSFNTSQGHVGNAVQGQYSSRTSNRGGEGPGAQAQVAYRDLSMKAGGRGHMSARHVGHVGGGHPREPPAPDGMRQVAVAGHRAQYM